MPRAERPDMVAYGVSADTAGTLPWSWAEERLARSRNYWLVTAAADARPHAMPVWGVWSAGDEVFVFSCAPTARKARNMLANPQVVVAVDDTVECVSVEAIASPLDPQGADARRYARAYGEKYEPDLDKREQLTAFFLQHSVWLVSPRRAFGIIEREDEFAARATRWAW